MNTEIGFMAIMKVYAGALHNVLKDQIITTLKKEYV